MHSELFSLMFISLKSADRYTHSSYKIGFCAVHLTNKVLLSGYYTVLTYTTRIIILMLSRTVMNDRLVRKHKRMGLDETVFELTA